MNEKEEYMEPKLEIVVFSEPDILLASGGGPGIPLPDVPVNGFSRDW